MVGRRRRRQKLMSRRHALQAVFVDLEGRAVEGEDPVLLGVLFVEGGDWVERRFVFDEACAGSERQAATGVERTTLSAASPGSSIYPINSNGTLCPGRPMTSQ